MFFFYDDESNKVCPHSIKKFELISEYVKVWVRKLMNYSNCNAIVFIDCMCNNGIYYDDDGNEIYGTPIRVSNIISEAMKAYPQKQAYLYFNDWSKEKVDLLKTKLPVETTNFHIICSHGDGNGLLKSIGAKLNVHSNINYLLVYDPYQATIDWGALRPFFCNWGEVIINHMISDTIRAAKVAKKATTIKKYENTYLTDIEELISFGSDKKVFEQRIEQIINNLKGRSSRKYYVAAFPFFNTMNTVVYNLIHCTGNIEGYKLYKKTAWKVFGDKSSMKDTHGVEKQLIVQLDNSQGPICTIPTDEYCYYIQDIVAYVQNKFKGRNNVPFIEIWNLLDEHPVFPSEGYRPQIKLSLKKDYGAKISKSAITFTDRRA